MYGYYLPHALSDRWISERLLAVTMSVISNTTLNSYVLANYSRQGIDDGIDNSTIGESVSEFLSTTDITINDGSWLALKDTKSTEMSQVTLVQVEAGGLDDIIGKLDQLSSVVDVLASLNSDSDAWDDTFAQYETLERELSQLIGLSTGQKTATLTINETDAEVSSQVNFVDRLTTAGIDGQTAQLAVVEVAKDDFLNGYHLADGCPICRAQAMDSALPTDQETATTKTSVGTDTERTTNASSEGYINPLISTYQWDFSADEKLSYSFYTGSSGVGFGTYPDVTRADNSQTDKYTNHASAFNEAQKAEMRDVYSTWDIAAPFEFEEVIENTDGNVVGDLRVAYMTDPGMKSSGVMAFAYYPFNASYAGDTWYVLDGDQNAGGNSFYDTNLTFADDSLGKMVALHEIGHSIGLSHPFDGSGSIDGSELSPTYTDTMRTTVMSYTQSDNTVYYEDSGSLTGKKIFSNTPMIYDVAAVEFLYGAITDANLGDTTYTFGDTSHQRIQTLVDSGGTDTLDLSDARHRSIVDLTPGSLSSIGYATETEQEAYWASQGMSLAAVESTITPSQLFEGNDNVGIAFSATIENVIGSAGADEVTGNAAANTITGNAGDDVIDGGDGSDTAVFNGNFAEYTITDNGDGTHTVTDSVSGRDGTDTVSNVETFQFADAGYSVSSGTSFGDANYRGGSNGGGTSNVYYSSFNRIDFGSRVMAPHEIAELKELLFNSVGDVSDLIEEALQSFVSQRASMSNVLGRLGSSLTQNSVNGPTDIAGVADTAVEVAREEASALASELKQEILKNAAQAFQAQQPPSTNEVNSLLAIT